MAELMGGGVSDRDEVLANFQVTYYRILILFKL